MKYVDVEDYTRKNIYKLFKGMDYPYVGLTANISVTKLVLCCKRKKYSFFKVFMYLVAETCNTIKEFKYRLNGERIVEYDIVHPSYILMVKEDAFNFCTVPFVKDFDSFYQNVINESNKLIGNIDIDYEEERDDLIFISCVPWVSFTHVLHPVSLSPIDSIPRIAWGKYYKQGNELFMPVNVQAHHALIDGFHIGIFYQRLEERMKDFIKKEADFYEF